MDPKTGISPHMVNFACSKTSPDSPVYQMTLAFCIQNWHNEGRVIYNADNRTDWEEIWHFYSNFRNELLWSPERPTLIEAEIEVEIGSATEIHIVSSRFATSQSLLPNARYYRVNARLRRSFSASRTVKAKCS